MRCPHAPAPCPGRAPRCRGCTWKTCAPAGAWRGGGRVGHQPPAGAIRCGDRRQKAPPPSPPTRLGQQTAIQQLPHPLGRRLALAKVQAQLQHLRAATRAGGRKRREGARPHAAAGPPSCCGRLRPGRPPPQDAHTHTHARTACGNRVISVRPMGREGSRYQLRGCKGWVQEGAIGGGAGGRAGRWRCLPRPSSPPSLGA